MNLITQSDNILISLFGSTLLRWASSSFGSIFNLAGEFLPESFVLGEEISDVLPTEITTRW